MHPGGAYKPGSFIEFQGFSLWISYRRKGKFKTKVLAARWFVSLAQAPPLSAAGEGLQDRKEYDISST